MSSSSVAVDRPRLGAVPGLALAVALAVVATALHAVPGLKLVSPMILAIVLGVVVNNVVGTPLTARPGIAFAMRPVLRTGIVLLGLQITPTRLVALGLPGLAVVAATLLATFVFTLRLGRVLGVRPALTELIAAGTSVCGASAVVATNGVSQGSNEDVAYAVATVTLFGSLSMVLYPFADMALGLAPHTYGLWAGASIHEIAQVVAAAFQGGTDAGEFGTIAKLARVAMLAPLVLGLGALRARGGGDGARAPFPWFVVGFLALVLLGGLVDIPATILTPAATLTTFLLTVALGAMGLAIDLRHLAGEGWRPLGLAAAAWVFVSGFALLGAELIS